MEQKKVTKKQLEKRIANAELFIDKAEKAVYFGDLGIGIYICKDCVIAKTNFHYHIWKKVNSSYLSMPSIYLEKLVEIANEHLDEIVNKNKKGETFHSFNKLQNLKTISDSERNIIVQCEMFLYVINNSIYSIGMKPVEVSILILKSFIFQAINDMIFKIAEKQKDITTSEMFNQFISSFRVFMLNYNSVNVLDDEKVRTQIDDIENNAYNEIKKIVEDNGKKLDKEDVIAIPKDDSDEVEALNEMQK